jgi:hypothetical protein
MTVAFIHFRLPHDGRLGALIAARRERLADLEASIEQMGEQRAVRRLAPALQAERNRWPRSAWRRFLREAARQATAIQPELHRLRTSLLRPTPQTERAASIDPARGGGASQLFADPQDIDSLQYRLVVPQSPAPNVPAHGQ